MTVDSSRHNNLRAAVRAIDGVVAPAVTAAGDQLATEQIGLVRAYLTFLSERLEYLPERSRFEFEHYRDLAAALTGILAEHRLADRLLQDALDVADGLRDDPGTSHEQVLAATVGLRAAVSRMVRGIGAADEAVSRAVNAQVARSAHRMIEFDRAWFLPQGWEPEPELVPSLDAVLTEARSRRAGR